VVDSCRTLSVSSTISLDNWMGPVKEKDFELGPDRQATLKRRLAIRSYFPFLPYWASRSRRNAPIASTYVAGKVPMRLRTKSFYPHEVMLKAVAPGLPSSVSDELHAQPYLCFLLPALAKASVCAGRNLGAEKPDVC
jgi:hypothetical protein